MRAVQPPIMPRGSERHVHSSAYAGGDATSTVPPVNSHLREDDAHGNAVTQPRPFGKPDKRNAAGRKRSDSARKLDFSIDKTIGRFEMIREIARGGMGQVFLG